MIMDPGAKAILFICLLITIMALLTAHQWWLYFRVRKIQKQQDDHADMIQPLHDMQQFRHLNGQFSNRSNGHHAEKRA